MGLRICSLLPSATEIVADLGLADSLVGVSAECDWPPSVRELPVVTSARIDTAALSAREIDAGVREALEQGESLYAVDEQQLDALDPDLVLTQDLCHACAVSSVELGRLASLRADSSRSIPTHRGDRRLRAGARDAARRGGTRPARRRRAGAQDRRRPDGRGGGPRREIFVCEWSDPVFAAGTGRPRWSRPQADTTCSARGQRVVQDDVGGGARAPARARRARAAAAWAPSAPPVRRAFRAADARRRRRRERLLLTAEPRIAAGVEQLADPTCIPRSSPIRACRDRATPRRRPARAGAGEACRDPAG